MQDRKRVALLIKRRAFNHIETHMLIKAKCPGVLFIHIHALYIQMLNGMGNKLLADTLSHGPGADEQHFNFVILHAHEAEWILTVSGID
ncbi:hypothetical protein D3C80_1463860 [compost metagenome]